MDLHPVVWHRTLSGGLFLVMGAGCIATTDSGLGRQPDARSSNPLEPPLVCTLIGCDNGLNVQLRPPTGWPAGEYRFRVQADGTEVNCHGTIPLAACAESRRSSLASSVRCDPEGVVRIGESGCALPTDAQGFPEIRFDPGLRPRTVEIAITRNGRIVGGTNLMPSFQQVHPNGPECPPACEMARVVLDLDLWDSLPSSP